VSGREQKGCEEEYDTKRPYQILNDNSETVSHNNAQEVWHRGIQGSMDGMHGVGST
jgi:hypothetical protein